MVVRQKWKLTVERLWQEESGQSAYRFCPLSVRKVSPIVSGFPVR